MAELKDLLRAALEDDNGKKQKKADEIIAIFMDEGTGERMHDDAIRWSMHEVMLFGLNTMSSEDDNHDACRQWAKMMRACAEHLIRHKNIRHKDRLPNIDWWHTMESAKEAS